MRIRRESPQGAPVANNVFGTLSEFPITPLGDLDATFRDWYPQL
jgi:hypothetical protein